MNSLRFMAFSNGAGPASLARRIGTAWHGGQPRPATPGTVRRLPYTERMRSVADDLRASTRARVLTMPVPERIQLALALGDEDLALFVRSSGLDRADALQRLRARRAHGRCPSGAAVVSDR